MFKKMVGKSVVYVKPQSPKNKKRSNLKPFRIIEDTQISTYPNDAYHYFDSLVNPSILPTNYSNEFDIVVTEHNGVYHARYGGNNAKACDPYEAAKKVVKRFLREYSKTTASSYRR